MVPSKGDNLPVARLFIVTGLVLLITGMIFGLLGAVQYVHPGFMKDFLSFEKVRPLHVSLVVFWILLSAMGSVLYFSQEQSGRAPYSNLVQRTPLIVLWIGLILILNSYILGHFGGREYWEFPPVLAILIATGWILFVVNVFRFLFPLRPKEPVYVWMWITGCIGFLITYVESYLWLFPHFQGNVVRDLAVQWKSYGSMVGSWNMLIYGTGIYMMEKISQDKSYATSKTGYALYFLGLTNMMFNWSHHIYTLPFVQHIQWIGYGVSMTELLILGRMIYKWKESLTVAQKFSHLIPYRFLLTADFWILINLILAIGMSVPAMNVYTHGTHITVAHSMGTTIGINTMILFAAAFEILGNQPEQLAKYRTQIKWGLRTVNASLAIFFLSLVGAGVFKAKWQMGHDAQSFGQMMVSLSPWFTVWSMAAVFMLGGFSWITYHLLIMKYTAAANKSAEEP